MLALEGAGGDFVAEWHEEVGEGVFVDEALALFDEFIEAGGELFEVRDGVELAEGEVDGDWLGVGFGGVLAFGSGLDLEMDLDAFLVDQFHAHGGLAIENVDALGFEEGGHGGAGEEGVCGDLVVVAGGGEVEAVEKLDVFDIEW